MRIMLVTALVMGALIPATSASAATAPRALWVWSGPDHGAISVAVADGFDTLFVHTPPGFDASAYSGFVAEAHAAGLDVLAMGGDPAWATDRSAWADWVREVDAAGLFSGVVADVEPYLLAEWSNDRERRKLIESYVRNLRNAARATDLDLVVAVPFWWDLPEYERRGTPLVDRVIAEADGIVVMAYRDHAEGADGIIEHAATEVAMAAARGKQAWVGVETGVTSLDKTTFREEGRAYLEGELATVDGAFGAGYGGIAVHHFGSWVVLPD